MKRVRKAVERNWRTTLRRVHLIIGGGLSIPLAILGITGSLLVVEPELQDAFAPAISATAGTPQALDAILAAATAASPTGYVPGFYTPPAKQGAAARLRLVDPKRGFGAGAVLVVIDPVSLKVLEMEEGMNGGWRFVHRLHANLLASTRDIVGWLGIAMLALGVSGLVLWWPSRAQWRLAFSFDRRARGATLLRQLHGMIGIWGVAVLLAVSFTGVYLAFPQPINAAITSVLPARDLRPQAVPRVTPATDHVALGPAAVVELARKAAPDARLAAVILPQRPDQPYRVNLRRVEGALPITVIVDPWTSRVVETRDPAAYTPSETLIASMHGLHEGSLGGPFWRLLVFLSGFLPPFFAGTGIALWLLRHRRRRTVSAAALSPRSIK